MVLRKILIVILIFIAIVSITIYIIGSYIKGKNITEDIYNLKPSTKLSELIKITTSGENINNFSFNLINFSLEIKPSSDSNIKLEYRIKANKYPLYPLNKIKLKFVKSFNQIKIESTDNKIEKYYTFICVLYLPVHIKLKNLIGINGKLVINQGFSGNPFINLINGQLKIEKFNGSPSIKITNGNLEIDSYSIQDIEIVNGNINLKIKNIKNNIRVSAVNGSIKINFSKKVNINLEASTVHGKIRVANIKEIKTNIKTLGSKNINLEINKAKYEFIISIINGNIKISFE